MHVIKSNRILNFKYVIITRVNACTPPIYKMAATLCDPVIRGCGNTPKIQISITSSQDCYLKVDQAQKYLKKKIFDYISFMVCWIMEREYSPFDGWLLDNWSTWQKNNKNHVVSALCFCKLLVSYPEEKLWDNVHEYLGITLDTEKMETWLPEEILVTELVQPILFSLFSL